MKVLITGGAGYLGTELVKKLVQIPKVKEIVVYDNLSKGIYNFFLCTCIGGDNIRFVQGDILDTRKLKKELKGVDIVFNLAAKIASPYADADPHLYEQINHWGTAELTYAIEESDVKKFVHVSSLSVYGASGKGKVITENTKLNPRTNYGISKMRGEGFVERLIKDKNIDTYIVRLGNVYGFNQTMRFDAVINRFAFEAN
ncbi:MAG TPA: SDR family oxidoreductase, partial [Chitinophagales bacterium]|nr:SDR family oxidoreductase [Chitinophagales bacterium]